MRCIFSCLGEKKSRENAVANPSKNQNHGASEITKPIKMIKLSQEQREDHLNKVTHKSIESKSYSKEKKKGTQNKEQKRSPISQAHSDSSMSSLFSYPINNGYKSSSNTEDGHEFDQLESSDSLFSISVNSKKQSEPGEKEVNSPMKIREWPEKEKKTIQSNQSRLNPIGKSTRLNTESLDKLVKMDNQEAKENVEEGQENNITFSSEDTNLKRILNLSEAEKETKIIRSYHHAKSNSIAIPISCLTQSDVGKLEELILLDEQEDKENIKSEQEIINQKSKFSEENKIIGSNCAVKTISLLNSIENLVQLNIGESRRFVLPNFQEEKQKLIAKNSSRFSETSVKEILVDTSLSSWLVRSERESDSPKSIKNSPDRENNPLGRYTDDNTLDEKELPIVSTIGSFLESTSTPPQAGTLRSKRVKRDY